MRSPMGTIPIPGTSTLERMSADCPIGRYLVAAAESRSAETPPHSPSALRGNCPRSAGRIRCRPSRDRSTMSSPVDGNGRRTLRPRQQFAFRTIFGCQPGNPQTRSRARRQLLYRIWKIMRGQQSSCWALVLTVCSLKSETRQRVTIEPPRQHGRHTSELRARQSRAKERTEVRYFTSVSRYAELKAAGARDQANGEAVSVEHRLELEETDPSLKWFREYASSFCTSPIRPDTTLSL